MSTVLHVFADLAFDGAGRCEAWLALPLADGNTVGGLLDRMAAGETLRLERSDRRITVRLAVPERAFDALDDLLADACRLAGEHGARGELVVLDGDGNPPLFGIRTPIPGQPSTLSAKTARTLQSHPGRLEILRLLEERALPVRATRSKLPQTRSPFEVLASRLREDPAAAFDEAIPLDANALHVASVVLGRDLGRETREVLRAEPRWRALLERVARDPAVHRDHRELAVLAVAWAGDADALALVVEAAPGLIATSQCEAAERFDPPAVGAIRGVLRGAAREEFEILADAIGSPAARRELARARRGDAP